jgi:hypothetical protein
MMQLCNTVLYKGKFLKLSLFIVKNLFYHLKANKKNYDSLNVKEIRYNRWHIPCSVYREYTGTNKNNEKRKSDDEPLAS